MSITKIGKRTLERIKKCIESVEAIPDFYLALGPDLREVIKEWAHQAKNARVLEQLASYERASKRKELSPCGSSPEKGRPRGRKKNPGHTKRANKERGKTKGRAISKYHRNPYGSNLHQYGIYKGIKVYRG